MYFLKSVNAYSFSWWYLFAKQKFSIFMKSYLSSYHFMLCAFVLFVSCLRNLCQPQDSMILFLSPRNLKLSAVMFRSGSHLKSILCMVRGYFFSHMDIQPHLLKRFPFPVELPWCLCWKSADFLCVYFWILLCSTILIPLSQCRLIYLYSKF